jgi:hypothetical protein
MKTKRTIHLVYQIGIANVFAKSPTPTRAPDAQHTAKYSVILHALQFAELHVSKELTKERFVILRALDLVCTDSDFNFDRALLLHAENAALLAERDRLRAALTDAKAINRANYDAANGYMVLCDTLRSALVRADSQFDLMAGYGLPGESADLCFRSMKDIASDAKRETSAALSATPPAAPSEAEQVNGELLKALTETADQLEDLIEATEGLSGLDTVQQDALANSRVVLRKVARAAQAKGGK